MNQEQNKHRYRKKSRYKSSYMQQYLINPGLQQHIIVPGIQGANQEQRTDKALIIQALFCSWIAAA